MSYRSRSRIAGREDRKAGPSTDLPTQRIELSHRPNAETPVQLKPNYAPFHPDWPEEWKTGILENGKAKIHPDEKTARHRKDFCCWAIENNSIGTLSKC